MTGAFRGDPALKDAVLRAIREAAPATLTTRGATEVELVGWATELDLEPALVLLAAHLAHAVADTQSLAADIIAAIEPGADTAAAAHWLTLWAWRGAAESLSAAMTAPEALEAGAAAAALHEAAARGGDISRAQWRATRTRLGQLAEAPETDLQAQAVGVMAACAWDYATTPGACVDLCAGWERLLWARLRSEANWGEAEDVALHALIREQRELAEQQLGPAPADADAAAEHKAQLIQILNESFEAVDNPLPHRHRAVAERLFAARAALAREAGEELGRQLRAAARDAGEPTAGG
jgi:hypothetical protein